MRWQHQILIFWTFQFVKLLGSLTKVKGLNTALSRLFSSYSDTDPEVNVRLFTNILVHWILTNRSDGFLDGSISYLSNWGQTQWPSKGSYESVVIIRTLSAQTGGNGLSCPSHQRSKFTVVQGLNPRSTNHCSRWITKYPFINSNCTI